MERRYAVGLKYKQPIQLGLLETEFRRGYIYQLGLFVPEEIIHGAGNLLARTIHGNDIQFTQSSFDFVFERTLEERGLINQIKSALELVKKLENPQLSFNPNLLILYLGQFGGVDTFETNVDQLQEICKKYCMEGVMQDMSKLPMILNCF
ncbi:hypothetical protein HYX00_01595 [Candidatus Woesearchaeota archaeon]|nr:hypothetical protein [Candidatus Woesearchaeota archaeon]